MQELVFSCKQCCLLKKTFHTIRFAFRTEVVQLKSDVIANCVRIMSFQVETVHPTLLYFLLLSVRTNANTRALFT